MKITAIKTEKILTNKITLNEFLDRYIEHLSEKSIVVITSKVISIIENRVALLSENKDELIRQEADHISTKPNKYGRFTTIKFNALVSGAGIDQSNSNGFYILLSVDPQKTAKGIYIYLAKKFKTKEFGVIISDSCSTPLRVGAIGVAIGFWGFAPLNDYVGKKDIFGRAFVYEKANVLDGLAAAAVLAMGEGREQTPVALIEELDQINFSRNRPNKNDLEEFYVSLEDDIFHQFYKEMK